MRKEALFHDGIKLSFNDELHHIDFRKLVRRGVAVYGQQEIVKDLIARRLKDGGQILFEAEAIKIEGIESKQAENPISGIAVRRKRSHAILSPAATGSTASAVRRSRKCRRCSTANIRSAGSALLRNAKPVDDELIYAYHERGFALFSMRSDHGRALLSAMRAQRGREDMVGRSDLE